MFVYASSKYTYAQQGSPYLASLRNDGSREANIHTSFILSLPLYDQILFENHSRVDYMLPCLLKPSLRKYRFSWWRKVAG